MQAGSVESGRGNRARVWIYRAALHLAQGPVVRQGDGRTAVDHECDGLDAVGLAGDVGRLVAENESAERVGDVDAFRRASRRNGPFSFGGGQTLVLLEELTLRRKQCPAV